MDIKFDPEKPFGGVPTSISVIADEEEGFYLSVALGPYPDQATAEVVKEAWEAHCISQGIPVLLDDVGDFVFPGDMSVN